MRAVELAMELERQCCEGGWTGFMAHEDFVWTLRHFFLADEQSTHKFIKGKVGAVALLGIEIVNTYGNEDQGIDEQRIVGSPISDEPYDLSVRYWQRSVRYWQSYAEGKAVVRDCTIGSRTALEISNVTLRARRKEEFHGGLIINPEFGFGLMV